MTDPSPFQHIRDPVHLRVKFPVGERAPVFVLFALPYDGRFLPAPLEEVPIQAVGGRVQFAAGEKTDIGPLSLPDPREIGPQGLVPLAKPLDRLLGLPGPEGLRVIEGLPVQLLVLR